MPEEPNTAFRVVGRVIDERQQPVVNASVRLVPGPLKATTDHEGAFAFDSLAADQYTLTATKDDFYTPPSKSARKTHAQSSSCKRDWARR